MTKPRLTRQELGWLLTQEAQGAAERLRIGVQTLRNSALPPPMPLTSTPQITHTSGLSGLTTPPSSGAGGAGGAGSSGTGEVHVEQSLDALDDVMRMLSSLHARPSSSGPGGASGVGGISGSRGRRGRIDLAAMLWEVAPEAPVSIEPGSGTEVYGDEQELRRMLHVLVGHGSGAGAQITLRREGDEVRLAVVLGPDSSATADTERAWLSRMAIRYGGRHELDGGSEAVILPAEGVAEKHERDALLKELDEARKQGEAYARELAQVFAHGEDSASPSTFPPMPLGRSSEKLTGLVRLAGGLASELRGLLSPLAREGAREGARDGARDSAAPAGSASAESVESTRKRLLPVQEVIAALAAVGEIDPSELFGEIDLAETVRAATRALVAHAERANVTIDVQVHAGAPIYVRAANRSLHVLARELVRHAIDATPPGSEVVVQVLGAGEAHPELGPRLVVEDAGAALPAAAHRAFVGLEVDPKTYGRSSSVPLYIAVEIASNMGGLLELSDAKSGGLRVAVTFPR